MAYAGIDARMRELHDLHVHGAEGYDTRTRRQDDIQRMVEIHGERGTAGMLPTIFPGSLEAMRDNMRAVQRARSDQHSGARIHGVHLEGPFLNPDRCGALDKSTFARPSVEKLKRLVDDYQDIVRIVTIAPELPGALSVIEACREMGFLVNMGHSDSTFEQAEEGKKAGATGITHLFNAMRGFHHREPGLAGFGLMDDDLYVEIIVDMAHLHPRSLKMVFDMKPPERIILVSDSVKGPGWGSGPIRGAGGVLLGSGICLADAVKNLVTLGVPHERALQFASENPRNYIGIAPVH